MRTEKVDEMLKTYRFDVGRCGHLETEIRKLERAIAFHKGQLAEDAQAVNSQQISDMPRGTALGNPTERIGLMLASGWTPDYIREMEGELSALKSEYEERYFTVLFVSSWLKGLTERERWIIEHQIIDGEYWKDVIAGYRTEFSEDSSKDSLKRLKQRALGKIYEMAC